ncbi:MAG: hypothetical protein JXB88_24940 [Spirochaetales bacterium]|nr:hypothetical protein [Spirochaetales bacterium]
MILDAYASTITHDSIDIRIISGSGCTIRAGVDSAPVEVIDSHIHNHNVHFFKTSFHGLSSASTYTIHIKQEQDNPFILKIKTLDLPTGKKICRFATLPDLHISSEFIHRPDSGKRLYSRALELAIEYYCIMR